MLLRGTGRGTGPEILDPGAVVYDTRYRATSNIINGFVLSYTRFSHDIIQRAIALASAVRGGRTAPNAHAHVQRCVNGIHSYQFLSQTKLPEIVTIINKTAKQPRIEGLFQTTSHNE